MRRSVPLFLVGFVVCLVAVVVPLVLVKKGQFDAMEASAAAMAMPPTTVNAVPVREEVWTSTLTSPASLEAVRGVTVATEVAGKVVRIGFEPGATLKAGDVLVELDASTEQAELRALEATAALAKTNLERMQNLHREGVTAHSELDASQATAREATARAESIRATIAKKTIRAPFDGRLGLRKVNLGQILNAGDPITTLQTLDPIFVNFALPQQHVGEVRPGTVVRVTTDAAAGATFEGEVSAISPEVDPVTRSLRVQATIANAEETLRPGMYASVEVVLPAEVPVLVIPATAVLYAPYGDSVFVVDETKKEATGETVRVLRQQFVRLGRARGDFVSVVGGVRPGETVVTNGVFKLRPGIEVVIDNTLAPATEMAPEPDDA